MTDFITYILITSAWIFGFHALFREGNIFGFIADWWLDVDTTEWELKFRAWVAKPFTECPVCMASAHGLLWFFVILPFCFHDTLPIRQLIPFLICLCGVNYLLVKFTSKERIIIEDE